MTPTEKRQFNQMRDALRTISTGYMTPAQIRRDKSSGLDYPEGLEMAYENIQAAAKKAAKGTRHKMTI